MWHFNLPSIVHILANPSYEPVAKYVPSHCKTLQNCYSLPEIQTTHSTQNIYLQKKKQRKPLNNTF